MTSPPAAWTRAHVVAGTSDAGNATPVIRLDELQRVFPGHDLWDPWPVREVDGSPVRLGESELWMGLCAPAVGSPALRHDLARIRMFLFSTERCVDLGDVFPDGASLGSREWAGCAIVDRTAGVLTVLYTAAGQRGESRATFAQRIAAAQAPITLTDTVSIGDWGPHHEALPPAPEHYVIVDQADGEPGFIKAFRDPFHFRDPATGEQYVLFVGSMAMSSTTFNGAIGIARQEGAGLDQWAALPPLLTADGVNNELERPHVVVADGCYYLFFSTQTRTFHPEVSGPTGLYGFVAATLFGPWQPINRSGLVLANPVEEPTQAYSWMVLPDLRVTSFVDSYSLAGGPLDDLDADGLRRHFGGTLAPELRLVLDGPRAHLDVA